MKERFVLLSRLAFAGFVLVFQPQGGVRADGDCPHGQCQVPWWQSGTYCFVQGGLSTDHNNQQCWTCYCEHPDNCYADELEYPACSTS